MINTTTIQPLVTTTTTIQPPETNTTTIQPPVTNTITIQPPVTNTTTIQPLVTTTTTIQLSVRNTTTIQPPVTTTTTIQPPVTNATTIQPPETNTTTIQPPVTNTTTIQPSVSNTTTIQPPMTTTTTIQPSVSNTTTIQPPVTNTTTIQPPVTNTTTIQPPVTNTTIIQPPVTNTTTIQPPGIHEFPDDVFTEEERQNGAFLLHVFCAMYMFYALALVCDDYFVPSLEKICEHLQLSEDVAGATFMAAGSSAPELFTSLIGVFIAKSDVGVGTIVGSAVFNILCIIGLCGIFTGHDVHLTWWSLFRDSVSYIVSVLALILVIHDEKVFWWEALFLALLYVLYIIVMKYNTRIRNYFVGLSCIGPERSGTEDPTAQQGAESNQKYSATVVILQTDHRSESNSVVMVDELFSTSPHKLSFPEASLRIMITQHFGPRTRLTMASRMLINERQRLIRSQAVKTEAQVSLSIPEKRAVENGASASADAEPSRGDEVPDGNGNTGEAEESNRKGEQENDGPLIPFKVPDERWDVVRWLISWPLAFLLYCTVPNCSQARWEKCFMATFICSTLWIGLFSYIMVWMVTIIGYSLGIPDVIMGITFLAAGTSVPDCMASLIVARQGMGDMAVSNSIGSNVFDILLGLGAPWMLRTLLLNYGSVVSINSKGIVYSVILLLASVSLMVIGIHLNKWKLDRRLGLGALLLYAVFLCLSILIELNVFLEVNLPTCQ
ncbi:sodium/potassium/calcium exchanger 3-like [Carcharodon carcharias]|uniref:sodium/potassium/calcium exchanger 3-like n=1 Tax=Carcharodon carcharias TaxID=13397 RepID=UPI001B7E6DEC|nr:sodium/potassium/calcium exchanger 3-like [Carcharodon carcharias]